MSIGDCFEYKFCRIMALGWLKKEVEDDVHF